MCTDTHKCKKTTEKAQRKQKRLIQLEIGAMLISFGVPLADMLLWFYICFDIN